MKHLLAGQIGFPLVAWRYDKVLTSNGASIDTGAGAIPPEFAHLLIVCSIRSEVASSGDTVTVRFNGDSGSNYYSNQDFISGTSPMQSTGEGVGSTAARFGKCPGSTAPSGFYATLVAFIANYSDTSKRKSLAAYGGHLQAKTSNNFGVDIASGHWDSTAAINQITFLMGGGSNVSSNSSLAIYGLL